MSLSRREALQAAAVLAVPVPVVELLTDVDIIELAAEAREHYK